jgi:hypothetical protein
VYLECGRMLPYHYILEFLDVHFQESSTPYGPMPEFPPRPAGIVYTHRLYDVPVVDLPLPLPAVPCHLCFGNDLLDACGWSLNPGASVYNVEFSEELLATPLGNPATRDMLQFCAPCLPGQLFMVPTCYVVQDGLPDDHPNLSHFEIQKYLHRLCSIIAYTCLPMRAHSYSVLSELDIFEYRASILSTFRYASDCPDRVRQVISSSIRLPFDPSDIYYPQWRYHQLPCASPIPLPPPAIGDAHHFQSRNLPLVFPPATIRHVSDIRAAEGQYLRNNERASRALLQAFLSTPSNDCSIVLYSTAGVQIGWYEDCTRAQGGIPMYIGVSAKRLWDDSSYMCHRTWRHPSILLKTLSMFPEGTVLREGW